MTGDEDTTNVASTPGPAIAPSPDAEPPPAVAPTPPRVSVRGAVMKGVRDAGDPLYKFLELIGGHLILIARAFSWLVRPPFRMQNYMDAAEYIGFGSLPIVLLVGASTGMVLSLQSVNAFRQFGLESFS